jgi:hypothetical protein
MAAWSCSRWQRRRASWKARVVGLAEGVVKRAELAEQAHTVFDRLGARQGMRVGFGSRSGLFGMGGHVADKLLSGGSRGCSMVNSLWD